MTSQLLTPANQITILRMAFIPVFVNLLLYNHSAGPSSSSCLPGSPMAWTA